jgi:hypothetical protein
VPLTWSRPESVSATVIAGIAETLTGRPRNLAGLQLGLTPTSR